MLSNSWGGHNNPFQPSRTISDATLRRNDKVFKCMVVFALISCTLPFVLWALALIGLITIPRENRLEILMSVPSIGVLVLVFMGVCLLANTPYPPTSPGSDSGPDDQRDRYIDTDV